MVFRVMGRLDTTSAVNVTLGLVQHGQITCPSLTLRATIEKVLSLTCMSRNLKRVLNEASDDTVRSTVDGVDGLASCLYDVTGVNYMVQTRTEYTSIHTTCQWVTVLQSSRITMGYSQFTMTQLWIPGSFCQGNQQLTPCQWYAYINILIIDILYSPC